MLPLGKASKFSLNTPPLSAYYLVSGKGYLFANGGKLKASLIVLHGPDEGRIFQVNGDAVDVGRDTSCRIRLSDSQISRRHIELLHDKNGLTLHDLSSRNGTSVNGRPVNKIILNDGDLIRIGQTSMHCNLTNGDASPSDPSFQLSDSRPSISMNQEELAKQWSSSQDLDALKRAKADLEILYRVGRTLNNSLELSKLLSNLLNVVFQEVRRIERCSIHMLNETSQQLESVAARMLHNGEAYQPECYSRAIAEQSMREKRALLVFDALSDGRFNQAESVEDNNIRSAICVPLQTQEHIVGIIHADTSNTSAPLTEDDLRLLTAIGLQAGAAIENARLYERLSHEKQALQKANIQLQATQKELIQSAKMGAVGQIASGVVHDIKTPMMVIMGYANLVREKLRQIDGMEDKEPGIFEYLNNIEDGVNHSNDVVNNLLKFARPSKPDKESVTANAIVQETMTFLKAEIGKAGIRLKLDLLDDPEVIPVDGNQVKQVLINVVMNAVQAMEETKGTLNISTTDIVKDGNTMSCIAIQDNGCGMTEDQQRRMFEPFFTTKTPGEMGSGGTGLGLSVSYSIIEQHGGTMDVESEVGTGTTFRVYLPHQAPALDETGPIEI